MKVDLKDSQGSGLTMDGFSDYSEYKNSGHEWLGKIPSHWKTIRANSKFDTNLRGCTPKKSDEDKAKHYSLPNIHEYGSAKLEESDDIASKKQIVTGNEILISKLNPDNGIVVLPENSNRLSICSTEFVPLITEDRLWRRFGYYYFNSSYVQQYLETEAKSVTHSHKRVKPRIITKIEFPDPPRQEQKAIVHFLDQETEKIDQLIEQKERLIELLEEKREALITRAVTKGLDPDAEMKDSGLNWLGRIPSHWEMVNNFGLFDQRDERGFPDLPFLNVSIHDGVTVKEETDENLKKMSEDRSMYKKAEKGDFVYNKMRMWQGACGIAPESGLVSPDYVVAKPREHIHPEFYGYMFRLDGYNIEAKKRSKGIAEDRDRLYWSDFKRIASLRPPLNEQKKIVDHIKEKTGETDQLIDKIGSAISGLEEYRRSLISHAVTGKIDVRGEV
jgi:type I restriction enzyme S subunit